MKKILMILILVVGFGGIGFAELPEGKFIEGTKFWDGSVVILCSDGYKFAIMTSGSKSGGVHMIQVFDYDPKLKKVVPAKCKK
jgi:hypothetical protein